jgi:hypothetical protein
MWQRQVAGAGMSAPNLALISEAARLMRALQQRRADFDGVRQGNRQYVVSRGFAKKQLMQWSKQGAHFTPANPNPRRHAARCVHQIVSGHRRQRYPVIASAAAA